MRACFLQLLKKMLGDLATRACYRFKFNLSFDINFNGGNCTTYEKWMGIFRMSGKNVFKNMFICQ